MPEYNESENTVTVTVAEFAEAIRKNGLPQHTGSLFVTTGFDGRESYSMDISDPSYLLAYTDRKVEKACAFGMGLINIGAYAPDTYIDTDEELSALYRWVWQQNDIEQWGLDEIADGLIARYADEPEKTLTFPTFEWASLLPDDFHANS